MKQDAGPSPDNESVGAMILDFPVSTTVRNTILMLKPPVCGVFVTVAEQTKSLAKH